MADPNELSKILTKICSIFRNERFTKVAELRLLTSDDDGDLSRYISGAICRVLSQNIKYYKCKKGGQGLFLVKVMKCQAAKYIHKKMLLSS
jgi:hypothetical protein